MSDEEKGKPNLKFVHKVKLIKKIETKHLFIRVPWARTPSYLFCMSQSTERQER
jgi:hypothetical protein